SEPFYPTRSGPPALRLSFGDLTIEDANEGIARLSRAFSKLVSP
ncbi:MAG: PLP-dependent aminotransferase family protein, partial [Candidatus Eremiobacteraeota bacterium]|nr:PLP-dependent aminotransferase family protein [Candidatus Eremiobacteraeota bacterium]